MIIYTVREKRIHSKGICCDVHVHVHVLVTQTTCADIKQTI